MRLTAAYRLFHYLSLAVSSLCLVVVLEPFIPNYYFYLLPVPFLFGVPIFLSERWSLPNWAANLSGALVLFIGSCLLWRSLAADDPVFRPGDSPAVLVPYASIVILLLIPIVAMRSRYFEGYW